MSMEMPQSEEARRVGETNAMQRDLVIKAMERGEDPVAWINKNGLAFRMIIDHEAPELRDLYRQDPKKAEDIIEERIKTWKPQDMIQ